MQRILAIAVLTWKAAFRFRLFVVLAVLLLVSVVGLPLLIKDDGTVRGFTQVLLTYTLTVISALLGLSTVWLACGTLARDIEECQMQVVAVKPIARWQIWLGKWLGIMSLNAVLLALSGGCVYGLLQWRATKLPPAELAALRNEVLVARGAAREDVPEKEIQAEADRVLRERLKQSPVTAVDVKLMRQQIEEQIKAQFQLVPPNTYRVWEINLGSAKDRLRNNPLTLRAKFNAADKSPSGTFIGVWQVGSPEIKKVWQSEPMSLSPDTFHEIQIPAGLYDENGVLTILFLNANNTALLFPLDEGLEVLYPEGGFALNFARGLGIIFCWMAVLATLGLMAASFLSFPVAAFFSLCVLVMVFSSGTMSTVVEEGSIAGYDAEAGTYTRTPVDVFVVPVFKVALSVINLARGFSPIDSLSTGRSITWSDLGQAFAQMVLLLGGLMAAFGIFAFHRRELATAHNQA